MLRVIRKKGEGQVNFLICSRASCALGPLDSWKYLGSKPEKSVQLLLADGTKIERDAFKCYLDPSQGWHSRPVISGGKSDDPILSVVTLQILGLVFNPLKRTLWPMKILLAWLC